MRHTIRQLLIITLSFLFIYPAKAQEESWIKTIESDEGWVTDLKANSSGHVYVAGGFEGMIGLHSKDRKSASDRAIYLAAFTEQGEKQWLKVMNGEGEDHIKAMDVDREGNVYLALNFVETLEVEGKKYTSTSGNNIFLAKISPSGKMLWTKHIEGVSNDIAHDIAVAPDGSFYLAGEFAEALALNTNNKLESEGDSDPFIARFDKNGNIRWADNLKAGNDAQVNSIAVDPDNDLIITGKFKGRILYNKETATAKSDIDLFAGKVNSKGEALWLNGAGECNNDLPVQLVTDNLGNIIIAGSRDCETPFPDAAIQTFNENDVYFRNDMMIVKLDGDGNKKWMKTYNGSGNEKILDVDIDADNNIYFIGEHTNSISMKNNEAIFDAEKPYNFILSKLSPAGELQWVEKAGGNNDPREYYLSVDLSSNVYLAGDFTGTENFREFEISNKGNNREVFLWRVGNGMEEANK